MNEGEDPDSRDIRRSPLKAAFRPVMPSTFGRVGEAPINDCRISLRVRRVLGWTSVEALFSQRRSGATSLCRSADSIKQCIAKITCGISCLPYSILQPCIINRLISVRLPRYY